MVFRMHSLSRSNKAQFFVLSTISIILILAVYIKIFSPTNIVYSSDIIIRNEFFVFNNIVEKAIEVVELSKDCEELKFGLEELKKLINENYFFYSVLFNYTINNCDNNFTEISFFISLNSPYIKSETSFKKSKNW